MAKFFWPIFGRDCLTLWQSKTGSILSRVDISRSSNRKIHLEIIVLPNCGRTSFIQVTFNFRYPNLKAWLLCELWSSHSLPIRSNVYSCNGVYTENKLYAGNMGRDTQTTGQLPVSTYQDPLAQFSQVTLQVKFYKPRVTDFSRLTATGLIINEIVRVNVTNRKPAERSVRRNIAIRKKFINLGLIGCQLVNVIC